MTVWIVPPVAGLIDSTNAPEINADQIGAIELNNQQVRIYVYSEQLPLEVGSTCPNKVVTGKITAQISNVPEAIALLASILRDRAPGIVPEPPPHSPILRPVK